MVIVIKKAGFDDLLNNGDYYLKALVIGEHGSGKTPFAAQWPKPLFAMCENGHLSLAQSGSAYVDIQSSADMQALLDKMRLESRKPIASRQFQTLVIDTIDSYQRRVIRERLRAESREALSGWADWGWLDGKMSGLIEELSALAMNVVVLMHTKDIEEENEGGGSTVTQRARMKGDIKEAIFQDFPLIGLMETYYALGEVEGEAKPKRVLRRRLRWHPDPKHPVLRDQSTKLPQFTEVEFNDQDYWQIFNSITTGLDDLPASEEIETLTVEGDDVPESVDEVGALEKPALPKAAAKKAAAKKTAAKKTAAKKSAAPAPETPSPAADVAASVEPTAPPAESPADEGDRPLAASAGEGSSEDPWQPPLPTEKDEAALDAPSYEVAKEAQAKAEAASSPEPEPEPEPKAEEKPAPKPAGNGRLCGSQPPTFVEKYDPRPGCGREIAPDDVASKVGLVKYRTYLCSDCIAIHAADAAPQS